MKKTSHPGGLIVLMFVAGWVCEQQASGQALSSSPIAHKEPLVLTYVANCGVLVSSGDLKVLVDALFDKPNPERVPAHRQEEMAEHRDEGFKFQPPEKIMDAIGLKPGMVIGEVGAGTGRFTVWLARRVGNKGLVYANDIDKRALYYLEKESQKNGLDNIKTILGQTHDPCFPPRSLDMVFMINVYNAFEDPVRFLQNIAPALKPGSTLAVILDDPAKSGGESERSATREEFLASVDKAGYKVEKEETFLPRDGLYVLRLK